MLNAIELGIKAGSGYQLIAMGMIKISIQKFSRHNWALLLAMGLSLILPSCKTADEDNPSVVADDVVLAFGGSCSSAGQWSQAAQGQTQNLITILKKLKDVDSCKNIAGILEDMNKTAAKIHGAYGDSSFLDYRQKEEELQELLLTLSNAHDAELISTITTAIVQKQVELASARAQKNLAEAGRSKIGFQDQYSVMNEALGSQFATLFSHASELSSCMQQSPSSAIGLFANLTSLAGSFVSPVIGANMQVLSGMMNTLIGYMRMSRIDKSIWDLYDSQMPQALTCGLESMTQFYCQAEDAAEIIMRQATSYGQPRLPPVNYWRGIDLVTRRLPVLNNWLLSVRSGVEPRNTDDAQRINRVREKRLKLDTTNNTIVGRLNDAKRKIDRTNDLNTKNDIKIQSILETATSLSGSTNYGQKIIDPFSEFSSSSYTYICMLLKGVEYTCPDHFDNQDERAYAMMLNVDVVSIEQIISDFWPQILDRVTRKVINEFNDVIFLDPHLLISQALEHSANNVSPIEILRIARTFLMDFNEASQKKHSNRVKVIADTLSLVDEAILTIENFLSNPDQDQINPLIIIYELFRLEHGTQYFNERIGEFVKADLIDRLDAGTLPEDLEEIMRSANEEVIHRLTASGYKELFLIKRDLDRAREQANDNYRIFREFMLQATGRVVKDLNNKSIQSGESIANGPYRTYGQSLAHLCLLLYATGDNWADEETKNICMGSTLFSVYPDASGERKLALADLPEKLGQFNEQPLVKRRKRICVYSNFLRAERLYEIMLPRQPGAYDRGGHLNQEEVPSSPTFVKPPIQNLFDRLLL